jgi:hypothetical protein
MLCSTSAFAQTPKVPKVGSKPLVQITPKDPTGCKLVGTVKGTKLWAGECEAQNFEAARPQRKRTSHRRHKQLVQFQPVRVRETQGDSMAKSNRESKKPKKEKVKTIAAAPSQKGATAGWQPTFGSGKKK